MGFAKYILPVITGIVTGILLIAAGKLFIYTLYPEHISDAAYALLILNFAVCSFLAGMVATIIAGRSSVKPALVLGIVLTLSGMADIIKLSQPVWFSSFSLLMYIPFTYFGYLLVRKHHKSLR
jgi:hypothetical protein